jgi:hypothetical protein
MTSCVAATVVPLGVDWDAFPWTKSLAEWAGRWITAPNAPTKATGIGIGPGGFLEGAHGFVGDGSEVTVDSPAVVAERGQLLLKLPHRVALGAAAHLVSEHRAYLRAPSARTIQPGARPLQRRSMRNGLCARLLSAPAATLVTSTNVAEVDGNRTRRTGIARAARFEGGGCHQVTGHLRRRR